MSGPSSQESAASTSDLREQDSMSLSNAKSIPGGEEFLPRTFQTQRWKRTYGWYAGSQEQQTFCAGDSLAKTSVSPASEQDSTEVEADSSLSSPASPENLNSPSGTDGSSWKTYQDFSPLTAAGTSGSCFKRWPTSGLLSDTEFSTASFSEFLNDAVASSLSDILEPKAHERFSLTQKGAAGVLSRASRGNRKLPERLAAALEAVAGVTTSTGGAYIVLSDSEELVANTLARSYADRGVDVEATHVIYNPHRTMICKGEWVEGWKEDTIHNALTKQDPPKGPPRVLSFHATQDPISEEGFTPALGASGSRATQTEASVRRLTPRECERLQGFPDDWTAVDGLPTYAQAKNGSWRCKEGTPDSRRYAAMGDAVTVNVIEQIAHRLMAVIV